MDPEFAIRVALIAGAGCGMYLIALVISATLRQRYRRPLRCALGLHAWPRYVNAYTQAPAPVRCARCTRACRR